MANPPNQANTANNAVAGKASANHAHQKISDTNIQLKYEHTKIPEFF